MSANRGKRPWERICVLGLGYVGLPTAAVLASKGRQVIGVDVDSQRVAIINDGRTPIAEPELASMVRDAVAGGRLQARTEVSPADAFIIAVPTPLKGDREPDLGHLRVAASEVAKVLAPSNLVVLESTSPVGTTEAFCDWLAIARPDLSFPHRAGAESDIRVAYSPERVLPGAIVGELVENDRIIGGITPECGEAANSLYGNSCAASARSRTRGPPSWSSSPKTRTATSTSRSPTKSRSSAMPSASTLGN